MNIFKKGLQVIGLLPDNIIEKSEKEKYKAKKMAIYKQFHENPKVHNYFHHLIATIMIEHYNSYPYSGINIPYRFKAPQSTENKLDSRLEKANVSYDENGQIHLDVDPIYDVFAMKIISRRRQPAFSSTYPEISSLIEERKRNQPFLEKMQEFKGRLIEDEYTKEGSYKFKYECTKEEYYEKCRELLVNLKELFDPKATDVLEFYDQQILDIDNRLEVLRVTKTPGEEDEIIDKKDLTDDGINFFHILTEYETKFYDKSDLAILTKQFLSLFENNKKFQSLGISLKDSKEPVEKKRTANGFESNFIYLNTPVGTIECQLQTENQYRYGNYGRAAHSNMKGKAVRPLPIPDVNDQNKVNNFVQEVNQIVPKSYLARMDDNEPGRVLIQKFNDYQNYKGLTTQVAKGDPLESLLRNYFAKLYALRKKIFKTQEKTMGFIDLDIEDYIQSDEFKEIKDIMKTFSKDSETKIVDSKDFDISD